MRERDELRDRLVDLFLQVGGGDAMASLGWADAVLAEIEAAGYELVGPLPTRSAVKSLAFSDALWRLEGHTDPFPDDDPEVLNAFGQRMTNRIQITVTLDRVPEGDGPEFEQWCERYGCYPLNSVRRAWCDQFSSYLRDAVGVAETMRGERFLVYEDEMQSGEETHG